MSYIQLTEEQEHAMCELYTAYGFNLAMYDTLKYLEENLGKYNVHTTNLRIALKKKHEELTAIYSKLADESNYIDVILKRID